MVAVEVISMDTVCTTALSSPVKHTTAPERFSHWATLFCFETVSNVLWSCSASSLVLTVTVPAYIISYLHISLHAKPHAALETIISFQQVQASDLCFQTQDNRISLLVMTQTPKNTFQNGFFKVFSVHFTSDPQQKQQKHLWAMRAEKELGAILIKPQHLHFNFTFWRPIFS